MEPGPPTLGVPSLSHWTTREIPSPQCHSPCFVCMFRWDLSAVRPTWHLFLAWRAGCTESCEYKQCVRQPCPGLFLSGCHCHPHPVSTRETVNPTADVWCLFRQFFYPTGQLHLSVVELGWLLLPVKPRGDHFEAETLSCPFCSFFILNTSLSVTFRILGSAGFFSAGSVVREQVHMFCY